MVAWKMRIKMSLTHFTHCTLRDESLTRMLKLIFSVSTGWLTDGTSPIVIQNNPSKSTISRILPCVVASFAIDANY